MTYKFLEKARALSVIDWVVLVILFLFPIVSNGIVSAILGNDFGEMSRSGAMQSPSWQPPGWVFGVVWTSLFLLMGAAAVLLWLSERGFKKENAMPFLFYGLVMLGLWVFYPVAGNGLFCGQSMEMAATWGITLCCIIVFVPHTILGALCMFPLLVWLSIANSLGYEIIRLNGCFFNGTNPSPP